jgi:hypothetical protein
MKPLIASFTSVKGLLSGFRFTASVFQPTWHSPPWPFRAIQTLARVFPFS